MDFFKKQIQKLVKKKVDLKETANPEFGEYCFGCFQLAKELKKNPKEIAKDFERKLKPNKYIDKIQAVNGYVNFFINKKTLAKQTLEKIFKEKEKYGSQKKKNKTVVIDFSSPNIAKPFGVSHLRSTVIGNSISKLYNFLGYKVIGVNHLGDWGTQFGKLIVAYKKWGRKSELIKDPIKHLLKIYVRFHKEAKKNKKLDDQARAWFKKLEEGSKEATKLWELFRELSIKDFEKVYKQLDVEFDHYHGEAFYNNKMASVIKKAKEKKITKISEGALIVELKNKPPLLLQKSDKATTYAARDLAAATYRIKQFSPAQLIYVVGMDQKLHFEQLFETSKKLGIKTSMIHVPFGMILFKQGKMSTRKGQVIFLEEVLDKAVKLALKTIKEKNPKLKNKQEIAKQVGIGAVIFGDLSNDRIRDIQFSWDKILDFEGETAPYLQYTHARACSILKKCEHGVSPKVNFEIFNQAEELKLICLLSKFPNIIEEAAAKYKPHILARYLLDLAQAFNEFYHKCPVISDMEHIQKARMLLVDSVQQVIKNSLNLLGIKAPEEM